MHHVRYALILAGGPGTRLWPMSRRDRPKQLLPLIEGRTLLQLSFQRLAGLIEPARRLVCGAEEHRRLVLRELSIDDEAYLGEPEPRDTLAALACSAALIAEREPAALIGVFTADHLIEPLEVFQRVVEAGFGYVEEHPQDLLTFGVSPTAPATGFGYLELGEPLSATARKVKRFHEKPDLDTARRYLEAGAQRYLWNSGMFVWTAAGFLAAVRRYQPELADGVERILQARGRAARRAALRAEYPRLKRISVDFGVMEPASVDPQGRVAAIPMPLRWLDIGSWAAYGEACPRDDQGNAIAAARSVLLDCRDSVVVSSDPGHLIAAVGCSEFVVVHTPDATLVCPKERAQQIKELLARLRQTHGVRYE